jgi:hypothetical protein
MTANHAELQAVLFNAETAWAEIVNTFGTALPLIDSVDLSGLARRKERIPHMRQYGNEGYQDIMMPWDGASITLRGRLPGLGATAAGAVPSSDMVTLLGRLIGATLEGLATGTTFTGGTATVPTTTAANGAAAGALVRGGSIGDGRVGGQWLPVASHAGNDLTLLLAAPVAPDNADVLYASRMVHPNESPGVMEEVDSFRLRVLTANGHYTLRGCFPLSGPRITGTSPGEVLGWEADIGVAAVETASATFPHATATQRHAGSPVTNGSIAYGTVGSTTRSEFAVRSFTMTTELACEGIRGPGGDIEGQLFQTAKRTSAGCMLELVIDAPATGTYTWRTEFTGDPNAAVYWQLVASFTVADGRAVGAYFPNLVLVEEEPIDVNDGGFNRLRLKFRSNTNTGGATELERSAWRLAFA